MNNVPSMKVGDLVQVTEPRSMGGRPIGAMGLILEKISLSDSWATGEIFKWRIAWLLDTTISWGKGVEVISESR
jgi:hypothetical protein